MGGARYCPATAYITSAMQLPGGQGDQGEPLPGGWTIERGQPDKSHQVSTPRILWILWSLGWVGFWALFGWFLFPINIVMLAISIGAIFLPIGRRTIPALRYDASYRPTAPSSHCDKRFSEDERVRYFKNGKESA